MSSLSGRSQAQLRLLIGGNPALTRAGFRAAHRAFAIEARRLCGRFAAATLLELLGYQSPVSLECHPSQETLAKQLGADRATVVRHLQKLEGAGLLVRHSRWIKRGRGGRASDWYSFDFGRVGHPELRWVPPAKWVTGGAPRHPVRAADGTFRRAGDALRLGGFRARVRKSEAVAVAAPEPDEIIVDVPDGAGAALVAVVQGEGKAIALDGFATVSAAAPAVDRRLAAARLQDDLRSCPSVARQWWAVADEAAEALAVDAELAQRGAGLLTAKAWLCCAPGLLT